MCKPWKKQIEKRNIESPVGEDEGDAWERAQGIGRDGEWGERRRERGGRQERVFSY